MSNHQIEGTQGDPPQDDNHDEKDHHQDQAMNQTMDQTMDQAVDKTKTATTGETTESLGVKWNQGSYSGKKLRAWLFFVCTLTLFFVVFGLWLLLSDRMGDHPKVWWGLLLILPISAWVHYLCAYFYRTWTLRYRLTSHRLYNEKGLFKKTIDTLEVIDIEDMQMEQTFFDRFINGGVGTVIIHSNDKTHSVIRLEALENPQDAFESIDEIRRKRRSSGARIIRSVNS